MIPFFHKNFIFALLFHGINYCKRNIYIRTGWSYFTPFPNTLYIIPDLRCNSRCSICYAWKKKPVVIPLSTWETCFSDIARYMSPFIKINISGGEVLLPGLSKDLLFYVAKKFPFAGITTNGYCMTPQLAEKLIKAKFSNINVSLDGMSEKTVMQIRGRNDAYMKTTQAIQILLRERDCQHAKTKIIIKTVITGINIVEIPSLISWVKQIGADGIYFQPIQPIFSSFQTMSELKRTSMWIGKHQKKIAMQVLEKIIQLKKTAFPILNDTSSLEDFYEYFELKKEKKTCVKSTGCHIDLDSLFISPNGDVHFCLDFPPIGNITKQSIVDIVHSAKAYTQRNHIRVCSKTCVTTCAVEKNLLQRIRLFFRLT